MGQSQALISYFSWISLALTAMGKVCFQSLDKHLTSLMGTSSSSISFCICVELPSCFTLRSPIILRAYGVKDQLEGGAFSRLFTQTL